jgi:5'-nucleotidase
MKKKVFLLVLCLVMALLPSAVFANENDDGYSGKTVVIITGEIRGNLDIFPLVASARSYFEGMGASVILADSGNFLQGTRYTAFDGGSFLLSQMAEVGYEVVALGKYDFAFGSGVLGTLGTSLHGEVWEFMSLGEMLLANPSLRAVSANISGRNDYFHGFTANTIIENGVRIGFFGLTAEGAQNHAHETFIGGLQFTSASLAESQQQVALAETDITIGLSNAENFMNQIILNAHYGLNLPSGTSAIVLVFDNETGERIDRDAALDLTDFTPNEEILAAVNDFKAAVHAELPLIGTSEITLIGTSRANHSGETNLGNFWADALRWFAASGEINAFFGEDDIDAGNDRIHVPEENIVALWNAGNLRDFLYSGDITIQDLRRVLPFPNTVAVVYLTGAELLEQLEASAQGLPFTPGVFGITSSFMHVSGIEYSVDLSRPFNAGENFRDRVWYTAASVERVTIHSINGNPFDESALYAVITSNANFNAMDISYVLNERPSDTENWSTITTARVVDHAVAMYIAQFPNATIPANRAGTQGRITFPYLPVRIIAEAHGAQVNWLAATSTVQIIKSDTIYTTVYIYNPRIVNGRAFVPAATIEEIFGA